MTTTLEKLERVDEPILIDGMSWREFKAVEQLLALCASHLIDNCYSLGDCFAKSSQ